MLDAESKPMRGIRVLDIYFSCWGQVEAPGYPFPVLLGWYASDGMGTELKPIGGDLQPVKACTGRSRQKRELAVAEASEPAGRNR